MDLQQGGAWLGLVFLGILLIVAGIQGSAGRLLAVALAPDMLDVYQGSKPSVAAVVGGSSTGNTTPA